MKLYTAKVETAADRLIVADDMMLTKGLPTAAGSRMLDGYQSLFEAEVLTRLSAKGYTLGGKADVGEFAIDLVGETSYNGADFLVYGLDPQWYLDHQEIKDMEKPQQLSYFMEHGGGARERTADLDHAADRGGQIS